MLPLIDPYLSFQSVTVIIIGPETNTELGCGIHASGNCILELGFHDLQL